jgi:hypothetical protein
MLALRVPSSFENPDPEKHFALRCCESCHSKRQLCFATAVIFSAWRRRILLERSRHALTSFVS